MLTRLEVDGFKNLRGIEISFGPLTCIAGANGVGKSNIFDAILFLRDLADKPFIEAVRSIRGGESAEGLFSAPGGTRMRLAAEMLIPTEGKDDFGQTAMATATFLRYEISLALEHGDNGERSRIVLENERLTPIPPTRAKSRLGFSFSKDWLDSAAEGTLRREAFISTDTPHDTVHLHPDQPVPNQAGSNMTGGFRARKLPRTVLSSVANAEGHRTAVLARNEIRSWRLLQFEPSALRQPDDLDSPDRLAITGRHVPATLFRLANRNRDLEDSGRIYATTANRLAELIDGVYDVRVDRDEARRTLQLMLTDRQGLELPASALSDGTMRFVALSVLLQDPDETGVLCIEEPENGIHPQRIDAMLELLRDIAVDPQNEVDTSNSLRQVIINTHSPIVVGRIADDDLIYATLASVRRPGIGGKVSQLEVRCLDETWRSKNGMPTVTKGELRAYLNGESIYDSAQDGRANVFQRIHRGQKSLIGSDPDEQ